MTTSPVEEPDYGDIALLVASAREWPREDFARELDARVAQRFAPEAAPAAGRAARGGRGRISRWTAGPAVALVAGAVAGGGGVVGWRIGRCESRLGPEIATGR